MSIKDLFNKKKHSQISKEIPLASASVQAEGTTYIEAKRKQFDRFVPPIDFSTASNYAKFGSSELYYENAFKRIYREYPYDGTLAEKQEFENSSSYLDRYIFDNIYPRTNGYAVFSVQGTAATAVAGGGAFSRPTTPEYISVLGGPHTASNGMINKTLHDTFDDSMLYEVVSGSKKGSSFETNMTSGSTIEFWMKKSTFLSSSRKQVIFDMWNGMRNQDDNDDYGRLTLMLSRSTNTGDQPFSLTLRSGSSGFNNLALGSSQASSSVVDGNWHHYAVTIQSASQSSLKIELFIDGDLDYVTSSNRSYIPEVPIKTSGLNAYLGALITSSLDNDATRAGDGKLSASLDDFRFWKVARTPEQINQTWNIPIGGGTNKHDSNKDLGLYFKFNEGVTGTTSTDSKVLDYSGRLANGTWTGYASGSRKTTSAFVESGKVEREFKDPIIYSSHPDVSASITQYKASGSLADRESTSMFYHLFPAWMQETDTENGKQLKYLSQIISSYFDTLWHQIGFLDKIHDKQYISGSNKALPFAKKLLESRGFMIPDLFVDASIAEKFMNKNESHVFEEELVEIKNMIYHNIYNNIEMIYKSKGTEKSFRNFFRSVGINSELVKLKMYADDSTYVLRDNYVNKSIEKNFLNFNTENHTSATVYQTSASADKMSSFINSGSSEFNKALTLEAEIILPEKKQQADVGYFNTGFLTASVAGFVMASTNPDLHSFSSGSRDIHIIIARDKLDGQLAVGELQTVRFGISSSHNSIGVQYGPRVYSQYNNNKWNLGLSIKDTNYPYSSFVEGVATLPTSYSASLYGIETDGNIERNSFELTYVIPVADSNEARIVTDRKRVYAGARRTAFSGNVIHYTDIKLGSLRYWASLLPTEAIDQHAYDPELYGTTKAWQPDILLPSVPAVPRSETLCLHWGFNSLTGAASNGDMIIPDLSSGSAPDQPYEYPNARVLKSMHKGRAMGFLASNTGSISKEYLFAARKRQPDDLYSTDLIRIMDESKENFFQDENVSDTFYSFEKSLYGTISEEMLNMFATVKDFANLIAQPNYRFHSEYHRLNQLKNLFFENVENNPNIEKFIRFYKWIDDSISVALQQLIPASARFSPSINNMVESHVLERNKYAHKIGLLSRRAATSGPIKGITELLYDWEQGHAPINSENQQTKCLWWSDRAGILSSSVYNAGRWTGSVNDIRDIINNYTLYSDGIGRRKSDGTSYYGSTYAIRKLAKPYNFEAVQRKSIHAGVNFVRPKNRFLFNEAVAPFGTAAASPNNIITVGLGDGKTGIVEKKICKENLAPSAKPRMSFKAKLGFSNNPYAHRLNGDIISPFSFISGTVHSGYNAETKRSFRSDVIITNMHSDVTDFTNEIPMQGPFTETHVGGHQSRHVAVNRYNVDNTATYSTETGGAASSAIIRFTSSNDSLAYGDTIRVQDFDESEVTAQYDSYYDLYNNKWNTPEELEFVLENKLDVTVSRSATTSPASGSFKISGSSGAASGSFITFSGIECKIVITTTAKPDSNPNYYVANTGSNSAFYRAIEAKMEKDGAANVFASVTVDERSGHALFSFTSSVAQNGDKDITHGPDAGSFYDIVNIRGGGHNIETYTITMNQKGSAGNSRDVEVVSATSGAIFRTEFAGGSNPTDVSIDRDLDDSSNRPEAFGIVMKEHPVLNDTDGAFGIVPADYGNTAHAAGNLPWNVDKPRATRFRDEHAKRPVNIRNILYDPDSTSVGNYRKGYEIVTLQKETQRRWLRDNKDLGLVLPASTENTLPETTNYLTLMSQAPWSNGNYFGSGSNRHPDKASEIVEINNVGSFFTVRFNTTGSANPVSYTTTQLRIDRETGNNDPYLTYIFSFNPSATNGSITVDSSTQVTIGVDVIPENWDLTQANFVAALNASTPFSASNVTTGNSITIYEDHALGADGDGGTMAGTALNAVSMFRSHTRPFAGGITDIKKLPANDVVIEIPRTDKSGSSTFEITNRFSAPGGPEVQSIGYLDAHSQTYSVHNAMPFRNLSVLNDSGHPGKIRVVDHINKQRGLRSLLQSHQGRGGLDSEYLTVLTASNYGVSGSFMKQHRNMRRQLANTDPLDSNSVVEKHDNGYVTSMIPRSEFQYSWIHNAIVPHDWGLSEGVFRPVDVWFTGSILHLTSSQATKQLIFGYAPANGIVNVPTASYHSYMTDSGLQYRSARNYPAPAITFPSGSTIFSN